MAVLSLLAVSCGLIGLSYSLPMGTWSDFGCNHHAADEIPGLCYVEEDSDFWGYSSEMWVCENGTMTEYEYASTDCSGNATDYNVLTSSFELDDYYCNAASSCNYFIMYKYTADSDCVGEPIDTYIEGIDGYCVNNSYSTTQSSYMYECSTDGWYLQTTYDTDDCTGTGTEFGPYDPDFYNWFWDDGDYRLYCSKDDFWSDCNQDGAINLISSLNIKLLSTITLLICLFY